MAELATIARPYAEALFRIAQTSNMNAWAETLSVMAQVAAVPEVRAMSRDPRVPRNVVIKTFLDASKLDVSAEAKKNWSRCWWKTADSPYCPRSSITSTN